MRPEVGIVGSKLIYGDGTIQHAGVILGLGGIAGHAFIGLDAKEYGSKSRGYEDTPEKQLRFKGEIETFQSKWQKELDEGDPYYNRNFPMTTEAYVLASE